MLDYFAKLNDTVQRKKDKPCLSWLDFSKLFKTGKQGLTGVLVDRKHTENKYAFKISQHVNYLAEHEFKVMNRLNDIHEFCPHFCRSFALLPVAVEPKPKKNANPFDLESKYPIQQNLLLEEYLEGNKLCKYIKSEDAPIELIFSAIKQTLAGISIAQTHCEFTHYDLHSDNVILQKCDYDTVFLYVLDNETAVAVPSYGFCAGIIDYGFAYVDSTLNDYLSATLAHTECGYLCDRFDPIADPKVMLISCMAELKEFRGKEKETKKFSNIVKNIFSSLNVGWDCGWDENDSVGASYAVLDKVQKKTQVKSKLFQKYGDYCLDLMLSLIKLPLSKNSTKNLQVSYDSFVREFSKFEVEIQSSVYNLYILRAIVDSARSVEDLYLSEEEGMRKKAIDKFRLNVIATFQTVTKFCSPKKIHYERLLCSLFSFADCASGCLRKIIDSKVDIKAQEYSSMPISTIGEILNILSVNLEDTYKFNKKTNVIVLDSLNKSKHSVSDLKAIEIEQINKLPWFMRGNLLNDMLNQKNDLSDSEEMLIGSKKRYQNEAEADEYEADEYEAEDKDEDEDEDEDEDN
jgi:hypothetical protein